MHATSPPMNAAPRGSFRRGQKVKLAVPVTKDLETLRLATRPRMGPTGRANKKRPSAFPALGVGVERHSTSRPSFRTTRLRAQRLLTGACGAR